MRKIILFVLLNFTLLISKAQVLLNLQLPQAGLQIKSQLWTMAIVNPSNDILHIKLDMTFTDMYTNQVVFSGSSSLFNLPSGVKQIQMVDLLPIQYNVLNTSYNVNNNPNGFLPVGAFTVCFSVMKSAGEGLEKIAEDCENIEVEPASPPFLTLPDDQTEIDQNRPMFAWLPPSPVSLFNNLNYELKLVEVNNSQSPSDAIQNNFPILNQGYIMNATYQYPHTLQALDTGKIYAWQVKALNNTTSISNSEIFTFKISKERDTTIKPTNIYIKLKPLGEIPFTICKGILKYEYINTYNNTSIHLDLIDITNKKNQIVSIQLNEQPVSYGQNFLQLDLSGTNTLTNNHVYQLEVSGSKGEKVAVKFIYIKED